MIEEGEEDSQLTLKSKEYKERCEKIKNLLKQNIDVNFQNGFGKTLLYFACGSYDPNNKKECFEIIKWLVENKSDINASNPIKNAAKTQPFEVIKYLIENKAYLGSFEKYIKIPFQKFSFEQSKYLLDFQSNLQCNQQISDILKLPEKQMTDIFLYFAEKKVDLNYFTYKNELLIIDNIPIQEEVSIYSMICGYIRGNLNLRNQNLKKFDKLCYILLSYGYTASLSFFFKFQNRNPFFKMVLEKYQKRSLWSTQSHQYFPFVFRQSIFCFHLVLNRFSKQFKIKLPKPVICYIINFMFIPDNFCGIFKI